MKSLLRWARTVDRPLPWRGVRDPYLVLVSEVMLQQTQAPRVVPAFEAFVARFPTVESLAGASAGDVLRQWGSLGYNRRAMHLWNAARAIASRSGFPRDVASLETLPGVGRYTARAVASFAFGADEAVVEANVRRILTRFHGLPPDADVWTLASSLVPAGRAGEWNQALFDLGALVCTPRSPDCGACPLARDCRWNAGDRPARIAQKPRSTRFEDTTRYARGRVVSALRERPRGVRPAELAVATGLELARLDAAVAALQRDHLVSVGRTGVVRLGAIQSASCADAAKPTAPRRARSR